MFSRPLIPTLVGLSLLSLLWSLNAAATQRVVCLGDSLTEGYGLSEAEAYPARLQQLLNASGRKVEVVNAGVSGATSASGPSKLRWQLRRKPHVVIIALGANDGLRGQPVAALQKNLDATISMAKKAGVIVLLAGMKLPVNYGAPYREAFEKIYPALAKKHGVALIPFLLEGVAAERSLNLPDGIHPNAAGYRRIAATVLSHLEPLL